MSESSCGGESSYSRSSHSRSYGESPSSSECINVTYTQPKEIKPDYEKIKKVLLSIEQVVTKNFTSEEKNKFLTEYRKMIVDNEKQIVAMPSASFFINIFNRNEDITRDLKIKIINGLTQCVEEEKTKNAALKYW